MAVKPQKSYDLKQMTSDEVLNKIRNMSSTNYREKIPVAQPTMDSIRTVGQMIMEYEPTRNEFLNMVNMIARVIVTSRLYENPWSKMKKGVMEFGDTIEEVWVELIDAQDFDPENAWRTVDKYHPANIRAAFHPINYEKTYSVSTIESVTKSVFTSMTGVVDLLTKIVEQEYTSAALDEFEVMKYMVARNLLDGRFTPVPITQITDKQSAIDFAKAYRQKSIEATFMTDQYNPAGVTTYSDFRYQYMIINARAGSAIDTEVLTYAFDQSKSESLSNILYVDSFRSKNVERLNKLLASDPGYVPLTDAELEVLDNIPTVMVDENWFQVYDVTVKQNSRYVESGDFLNTFLINRKTFSVSPFATAMVFVPGTPTVDSLTVEPNEYTVYPGQNLVINPVVKTTNCAPQTVNYVLPDGVNGVTVSPMGVVTISGDADKGDVTITVVSTFDNTKTATVKLTIA